jgi:hypothetical protein
MEQQIVLINEMISENPDATIRDFLDLLNDIELIEATSKPEPTRLVKYQGRNDAGRFTKVWWLPSY